ncbi:A24 family peptidase [Cupriavidus agavae]|uniref:Prepilin peptidase CpaA n=1 Tax=Cupriavidus agavae TaxID=1001822 RepID=A0A4Q7SAJ0_9BURK|nr:prepilin peptidase [Cupriavidus agavae]RZT42917.1 prepilin peptidase CpaA [Cupriavidus agavae]
MQITERFTAFDPLTTACLLAVLGVAVVTDVRSHRIPNRLIVVAALAALGLQMFQHGMADGAWRWATGLAAGLVPLLLLYIVRAVGAGDAKLMACVGALAGAHAVPAILLGTVLAGGVLGLAVMLARRETRRTLQAVLGTLLWLPFARDAASATPAAPAPGSSGGGTQRLRTTRRLPYAVAIAAGVVLAMARVF